LAALNAEEAARPTEEIALLTAEPTEEQIDPKELKNPIFYP